MNQRDMAALAKELAPTIRRFVGDAIAPLADRLKTLEARPEAKDGIGIVGTVKDERGILILTLSNGQTIDTGIKDGKRADDLRPIVEEEVGKLADGVRAAAIEEAGRVASEQVSEAVKAIPAPPEMPQLLDSMKVEFYDQLPDIGAMVAEAVTEAVAKAVEALPTPKDGKDVDAEQIAEAAKAAVEGLDIPTREQIEDLARNAVDTAVKEIELPEVPKGPTLEEIAAQIGEAVKAAVAELPKPEDGKSVTVDDVRPLLQEIVDKAIAEIPQAKDGVGMAGGLIDRNGNLILSLTDGTQRDLGKVVGKDGDNGKPGLGFEDLDIVYDGERSFVFRLQRGEQKEEFAVLIPIVLDRGVWKDGEYKKGDSVSLEGSSWIAQADTKDRPGVSDAWRLATKRGRDGKSVKLEDVKPLIDRAVSLAVNGLKNSKSEKDNA
jgi:hypothetical protein